MNDGVWTIHGFKYVSSILVSVIALLPSRLGITKRDLLLDIMYANDIVYSFNCKVKEFKLNSL